MVEVNYDVRIFLFVNVYVCRWNLYKWYVEGINEGEFDFVSEFYDFEKEDIYEVVCEEFFWNGYYEDDF